MNCKCFRSNDASTLKRKVDDMDADNYTAKLFEQLCSMLVDAERSKSGEAQNILQNEKNANYIEIYASRFQTENPVPPHIPLYHHVMMSM